MASITPASTSATAFVRLAAGQTVAQAIAALDAVSPLNLVAMPDLVTLTGEEYRDAVTAITDYCIRRGAFFIVDPPADWTSVDAASNGVAAIAAIVRENGAIYWPQLVSGPASPAVAAVYAATDESRGVWKAPAGLEAVIPGEEPAYKLTDAENGLLNPIAVSCIRTFLQHGTVVWGARTLAGADELASDWKYVQVRRTIIYIEQSIKNSLQWTQFEPNNATLWASIRLSVTSFLTGLWQAGGLAGTTAKEAFTVTCDSTTTTPEDIANGVVNIIVAVAPTLPAEFIVLQIQALAGVHEE